MKKLPHAILFSKSCTHVLLIRNANMEGSISNVCFQILLIHLIYSVERGKAIYHLNKTTVDHSDL